MTLARRHWVLITILAVVVISFIVLPLLLFTAHTSTTMQCLPPGNCKP
jgi:hypothetical protein